MTSDPLSEYDAAVDGVLSSARRLRVANESEPSAHHAAEIEYATELLAFAARRLTEAANGLPSNEQPVGWNDR